ncbi:fasciclin domain-containing protein [Nocardioides soli]|uniref:Putative surface protein with fasciclin (FAS1) repeats n=1 Tax=Nocardioides soli TaxID=1036020 RepID=A0A7W4W1J0_9ACTN|nr:fasciclin domain-containing protein [Nocardioides soli]MBB3045418.1 putative surface protein with fasciclin (FAS1) repeats [Nocardioides soli]
MNRSLRRTSGIAVLALTTALGLAACSSDDSGDDTASDSSSSMRESPSGDMSQSPSDDMSSGDAMDAGAQTFGAGCSSIPSDGAGSFDGMATEPVATAASGNPLLTTLVAAVDKAGLVDTLNSADGVTVFAPTDDAFAKIPKKDLNAVMSDKATLTEILTYHVVPGQLTPDQLAGSHQTLEGEKVVVEGSGEDFTVGADSAKVLCGNIPTANATVYVIDSVLMPGSMG